MSKKRKINSEYIYKYMYIYIFIKIKSGVWVISQSVKGLSYKDEGLSLAP